MDLATLVPQDLQGQMDNLERRAHKVLSVNKDLQDRMERQALLERQVPEEILEFKDNLDRQVLQGQLAALVNQDLMDKEELLGLRALKEPQVNLGRVVRQAHRDLPGLQDLKVQPDKLEVKVNLG